MHSSSEALKTPQRFAKHTNSWASLWDSPSHLCWGWMETEQPYRLHPPKSPRQVCRSPPQTSGQEAMPQHSPSNVVVLPWEAEAGFLNNVTKTIRFFFFFFWIRHCSVRCKESNFMSIFLKLLEKKKKNYFDRVLQHLLAIYSIIIAIPGNI